MRRLGWAGLLVVVLAVALTTRPVAQGNPLVVLSRDGRRAVSTTSINNQDYLSVDDVNAVFGTSTREDRSAGGLTITAKARSIAVSENQNVVSVGGRLVSLAVPPVRRDNRWFVPVDFLSRALALALESRIDWRRQARLLVVGDLRVPRVVARLDAGTASTTVTFEVSPATDSRIVVQAGRLVLQFEADALEYSTSVIPPQPLLTSMSPSETGASVVLTTGPRFASHRVTTSSGDGTSGRVIVDLLPAATTEAAPPSVTPAPARPLPTDERVTLTPPPSAPGLRTVVIDPGHGGDEAGAKGSNGALEKDITLAMAKRLRTTIESRLGLKVYLTREDDRTMSLDERAAFANNHQADVFLSLHANAALRPTLKGAEVYHLLVEGADVIARKRADDDQTTLPALGGSTRALTLIPWDAAQARHQERSTVLADLLVQALAARVEMNPRAIQQAPFRVLVGANMPAALIEIGYLTNVDQETQLGSAEYQDLVAQALLDGLVKFRESIAP
jgi:N-acetylmuramoyl-L-alanine amidase